MNISAVLKPVRAEVAPTPAGQVAGSTPAFETLFGQANAAAVQPTTLNGQAGVRSVPTPPGTIDKQSGDAVIGLETPLPGMTSSGLKPSVTPEARTQPAKAPSLLSSPANTVKSSIDAETVEGQDQPLSDKQAQEVAVAQPVPPTPQAIQPPTATPAAAADDGSVDDEADTSFPPIPEAESKLQATEQPRPHSLIVQVPAQVQLSLAASAATGTKASDRKDATVLCTVEVQAKSQPLQLADIAVLQQPTSMSSPAAVAAQPLVWSGSLLTAQLDLSQDAVWIDQLAREIVAVASNDGKLRFSLSPEGLGQLDVAIQTQKDGVEVRLQPSNETAARIFAAEQPKLVDELRQSGVRVVNSDLMSGHQTNSQREQSPPQYSAQQVPLRGFAQASATAVPAKKTHNERFA